MSNDQGYEPFHLRCRNENCGALISSLTASWHPVTYKASKTYRYITCKCPTCGEWASKYKVNLTSRRSCGDSRKNFPKARNGIPHNTNAAIEWIERWSDDEVDTVTPEDSST